MSDLSTTNTILQYSEFNCKFTFPNEFYAFILLISVLSFQFEEVPFTFLVGLA